MFCRNCGAEMADNARICMKCGVMAGDGDKFCSNCGAEPDTKAVICVKCGPAPPPLPSPPQERPERTAIGIFGVAYSLFILVTLLSSLAVTIRRLHDTGKSGWNFLIALIPIIGALALIIWLSMPGNYYAIYRDGNIKSHNQ